MKTFLAVLLPLIATALRADGGSCKIPGFAPGIHLSTTPSGSLNRLHTADFNLDGRPDLAFLDAASTSVVVLLGDGRSGFALPIVTPLGGKANGLGFADIDGDGKLDLVVSGAGISVLFGDAEGRFEAPVIATTEPYFAPLPADVDGDGRPDIVAQGVDPANPFHTALFVYLHDGPRSFKPPLLVSPNQSIGSLGPMAAGDFDRDGNLDLAVTVDVFRGGWLSILIGDGKGGFRAVPKFAGGGSGLIAADLDGDGNLDLVASWYFGVGVIQVFAGDGHGGFRRTQELSVGLGTTVQTLIDLNGDGKLDVVASGFSPTTAIVATTSASGTLDEPVSFPLDGSSFIVADTDGDGRPDLVSVEADGLHVRRNVCGSGSATATLLIPFVLSAAGVDGTYYGSTLSLVNHGSSTADVALTYTAASGGEDRHLELHLAGGEQRAISHLVDRLLGTEGGGTLRLGFSNLDSAAVVSASVTFESFVDFGQGYERTAAFSMPAVRLSEALFGAATVAGLREDAGNRTNVAVENAGSAGEGDVVLRLTIVSTDPRSPGRATLSEVRLSPGGFFQSNRALLTLAPARSGYVRVERVSGAAPYLAYAVRHDSVTGDGTVLSAVADGSSRSVLAVVPAVVETPTYSTELWAVNTTTSTKKLEFFYHAEAVGSSDHSIRFSRTLEPGEEAILDGVVAFLRSDVPSILPVGANFAGSLSVLVQDGIEGVQVGARVTTAGRLGGRVGTGVPAIDALAAPVEVAWLDGLVQGALSRTNIALMNLGGIPSAFRVELFDGATGTVFKTSSDVTLRPDEWRQLPAFVPPSPSGDRGAYARVTRLSGNGPFIAYAVRNDGLNPGEGSGDADFILAR